MTQGLPGSPRVWAGGRAPQAALSPCRPLSQALAGPLCPGGTPACPPTAPLPPCLRGWDSAGASPY